MNVPGIRTATTRELLEVIERLIPRQRSGWSAAPQVTDAPSPADEPTDVSLYGSDPPWI